MAECLFISYAPTICLCYLLFVDYGFIYGHILYVYLDLEFALGMFLLVFLCY